MSSCDSCLMMLASWRLQAQTVIDVASSHKINYVAPVSDILNIKVYQNCDIILKNCGDFAEWVSFAYWWSCIGKGLRLQSGQKACLVDYNVPHHSCVTLLGLQDISFPYFSGPKLGWRGWGQTQYTLHCSSVANGACEISCNLYLDKLLQLVTIKR